MKNMGVVLMDQSETKIYAGDTGYIVIKQQDWQGNDQTILIDPVHAKTICDAIMDEKARAEELFKEWKNEDE